MVYHSCPIHDSDSGQHTWFKTLAILKSSHVSGATANFALLWNSYWTFIHLSKYIPIHYIRCHMHDKLYSEIILKFIISQSFTIDK